MSRRHPIDAFGNKKAKPGDIRVERLEQRLKPRVPFPHQHDFYHFLYFERAAGWHEVDFTRFRASRDQVYAVLPGQVHAWKLSPATRGFVVEFTRESFAKSEQVSRLLVGLEQVPAMLAGETAKELKPLFVQLFAESETQAPNSAFCLEHLTLALLARMENLGGGGLAPSAKSSSIADRFQNLVDRHFNKQHSVEFYAAEMGLTSKTLTSKISKILGKSAGTVVHERCLLEAKRLLSYSEMSVAEIGYQIGFEDPNYFARFFKQRAGATPGEFRRLASRSVSRGGRG